MKPDGTNRQTDLATDNKSRDRGERIAPKIEVGNDGVLSLTVHDENQLRELFGVRTDAAANGIMASALNALGLKGDLYRNLMTAIAVEMEPRDASEAMLVSQQVATHVAMMTLSGKMMDATSPQLREGYERSMTRLSRTFLAQVDALKRYRAKAQQVVRVERVDVHSGGQAVVGSVQTGGRGDEKKLR